MKNFSSLVVMMLFRQFELLTITHGFLKVPNPLVPGETWGEIHNKEEHSVAGRERAGLKAWNECFHPCGVFRFYPCILTEAGMETNSGCGEVHCPTRARGRLLMKGREQKMAIQRLHMTSLT